MCYVQYGMDSWTNVLVCALKVVGACMRVMQCTAHMPITMGGTPPLGGMDDGRQATHVFHSCTAMHMDDGIQAYGMGDGCCVLPCAKHMSC
jgi:hypothetical protein